MSIAMVGTRGVPASYGGFETAVDEIGGRLVARGHSVTVYCRNVERPRPLEHKGMRLVHIPALRGKAIETLSHTGMSVAHLVAGRHPDAAFIFNAANSPYLPILRMARIPTAVHVDGLEWKRGKWGPAGRRYYREAEKLAVRLGDALIADASGIADYYREEFDVSTELLTYGATIQNAPGSDRLPELGLTPGSYHLVVARFEPENHVDLIVEGYSASDAREPLVIVGSAPYSAAYTDRIARIADGDPRIRMLGAVWDQVQLDQLYGNALTYLHGHSVGGTNPSLLRAMGAGTAVIAWDVNFNREVLGDAGAFFSDPGSVRAAIEDAEFDPARCRRLGTTLRDRASNHYDWDDVARGYENLALSLAAGFSIHNPGSVPGASKGARGKSVHG